MKTIEELERTIEAGRVEDGRMQREIFELQTSLARVRGLLQRQWISVEDKEQLPEPDRYLVAVDHVSTHSHIEVAEMRFGEWILDSDREQIMMDYFVTHWMPLPTIPQFYSLVSQGAESADIGKLERPVPAMTNLERRALEILSSLKAHAGRTHPGDGNPIDSLCPDHNVAIEKLIEDLQDEALKE